MKQFFRLLFICFGLLLVLGVNRAQSHEIADIPVQTTTLTPRDFQAAMIPATPAEASLPLFTYECLSLPKDYCSTTHQKEIFTARVIHNSLRHFKTSFWEFCPDIPKKKGIHIYLPSQKAEPSRA